MVTRTKKIFVGGLSANTVVEDVKQYFEQFGKVRIRKVPSQSVATISIIIKRIQQKVISVI